VGYSALLTLHICGAIIGLLSGTAALIFRKGFRLHRAAGTVFFVSMLIRSASGAKGMPPRILEPTRGAPSIL